MESSQVKVNNKFECSPSGKRTLIIFAINIATQSLVELNCVCVHSWLGIFIHVLSIFIGILLKIEEYAQLKMWFPTKEEFTFLNT